ncbi:hypothetical protein ACH427_28425 [Streptomyces sp. NPDC020379]|uniref:hypothetical protein n=1 Tax=Streptomyces sp. NPDC020379 TaxID=3365071 RepID=UPI003794A884
MQRKSKLGVRSVVVAAVGTAALLIGQGAAFGSTEGWDVSSDQATVQPGATVYLAPVWNCGQSSCTYDQNSVFRIGSLNDASLYTDATPNLVKKNSGARVGTCEWNSGMLLCSPTAGGTASSSDALTLDNNVAGRTSASTCTESFYVDWWDGAAESNPDPNGESWGEVAEVDTSGPSGSCQ